MSTVPKPDRLDRTDARLLLALNKDPRGTVLFLASQTGLSRNTVQARLAKYDSAGVLEAFERRIDPGTLGYPLNAFIWVRVTQRMLGHVADALAAIAEVIEVTGISGPTDLLVRVAAADADGLYRIAGQILAIPGVERTDTGLAMRHLVDYRVTPLLQRLAGHRPDRPMAESHPDNARTQ